MTSRRDVLQGGTAFVALLATGAKPGGPRFGFRPVPVSREDTVVVPEGYEARVLYAWGDPVSSGPAWDPQARNSIADQEQQAGMEHDGMFFFPLEGRADHGLLALNHESIDDGLLHVGGTEPWTAEKVGKAQAAVGVSVIEVRLEGGRWQVVRPSRYGRRITARTPTTIAGPAAGHALLRTSADPSGRDARGTFANCASGRTPWGTYLTCEENFTDNFGCSTGPVSSGLQRYGVLPAGLGYRWHEHDPRFDVAKEPNEANRFGWVVEIDPRDPASVPVKRTALGRFKHETATVTLARDGRVVVYMGDDEVFEYLYKFVSRHRYRPGRRGELLDEGTLHVARLDERGRGRWIPLPAGGEALVHARQAADALGATRMDRPEWLAVHPASGDVYCALTNNALRGQPGRPGRDRANPRSPNLFGHVLKMTEHGDAAATSFHYEVFAMGDPLGSASQDGFACPDGLTFDAAGRLWIQTDVSALAQARDEYKALGNNMLLVADPETAEIRRFLTGPRGCEVTGATFTPDHRTLFVNIQHPGETKLTRSDPKSPGAISTWPDGPAVGRPRSATIAVRRRDGGVVGT